MLSLPYHHPLMVADRMQMLDHLTHGRAMLGVGPGALTSDAYMLGIDPTEQRRMMYESIEAILALLRGDEPVTMETDWFTLNEARLQMSNFTKPHLEVAVTTTFTPSGATAAGRYGIGLLSVAGASHDGFTRTWGWVEDAAAEAAGRPRPIAEPGAWCCRSTSRPPASRRSPRSRTATAAAPTSATLPRSTRARRSARHSAPPGSTSARRSTRAASRSARRTT